MKLNIGCGANKLEGFVNVDVNSTHKPDKIGSILKLPFSANTFDYVYCHHVIEHVDDTIKAMDEMWRVTKNGGIVEIHTPHWMNEGAWGHPEHKRAFNFHTFEWFCLPVSNNETKDRKSQFKIISKQIKYRADDHAGRKEDRAGLKAPLLSRPFIHIINYFANKFQFQFDRFWGYWVGGAEEIIVKLQVVKSK